MASLVRPSGTSVLRRLFPRTTAFVLLASLTGAACAQAPDAEPAGARGGRAPAEATSVSEAFSAGESAETETPSEADIPAVEPLSREVASCAPPATGSPWAEVARATDGGNEYVWLEHADAGASANFDSAVVLLAEGGCEYEIVSGPGSGSGSSMRRPSNEVWEELVDGSFTWHVTQSGGVEAFADVQRRAHGGTFAECAPGADPETCVPTWLAMRFRRAGVGVAPADG